MDFKFVVITKSGCPECVAVKALLKSKGIAYEEKSMDSEDERKAFYEANPGVRSMPQVFVNDQRVGGMAGVRQALAQIGV